MDRATEFTEDTLTADVFGIPSLHSGGSSERIDAIGNCVRWQSHLAWAAYTHASALHTLNITRDARHDLRAFDDEANTATHLSATLHVSPSVGDAFLREAIALTDRIPRIGACLRDGVITQAQFKQLVTLTVLIQDQPYAPDVDDAIARELRRTGVASSPRLRDMANRFIYRQDPDAIRRRREEAVRQRSAGSRPLPDGMAQIGITASAEDAALAMAALNDLAGSVCEHDSRSLNARRSDAVICRIQGIAFVCDCGREDCAATPEEHGVSERQARIVLHVIWELPTPGGDHPPQPPVPPDPAPDADTDPPSDSGPDLNLQPEPEAGPKSQPGPESGDQDQSCTPDESEAGESEADDPAADPAEDRADELADALAHSAEARPPARVDRAHQLGFLDGYGVIASDHIRAIALRPDTIIRPINPNPGNPLPTHQPADPYRFSTALDAFIRARDGYCVFPGCPRPAWPADLDHVNEYDHARPHLGGQTTRINCNAKCRHHHNVKTFGRWLDDQYVGPDGLTHTEVITPDGYRIHTHGHTNEELFPALRDIEFRAPPSSHGTEGERTPHKDEEASVCDPARAGPQRRQSRHADKLARRRHERKLNRIAREQRERQPPPPDAKES